MPSWDAVHFCSDTSRYIWNDVDRVTERHQMLQACPGLKNKEHWNYFVSDFCSWQSHLGLIHRADKVSRLKSRYKVAAVELYEFV